MLKRNNARGLGVNINRKRATTTTCKEGDCPTLLISRLYRAEKGASTSKFPEAAVLLGNDLWCGLNVLESICDQRGVDKN
jgi:hypothetical protein